MDKNRILQFLKEFKEENKNKYHIERIGVFGSVSRNEARENSDIDVVVELEKQDLFEIIGIKQDLQTILHCPIDVVSYRYKMNSFLKNRIDEEAIYV